MKISNPLSQIIFMSRWLQVPLYLGLIFVQGLYAYRFVVEVYLLLYRATRLTENDIMMGALSLIDIVLISNLLAMIIIGGYETFVSRLNLKDHPDEPEWLDSVSTGTLKIKLAMSLVSIASIHLLRSFLDVENQSDHAMMWQTIIVLLFIATALSMAWIDRINHASAVQKAAKARAAL